MERDAEFWKALDLLQNLKPKRRVSAHKSLNSLRVTRFKVLHRPNTSVDEFAYSNNTYALDLLHLQWTVIPRSGAEASLQHQRAVNAHRVAKIYLAVYDASYQAADVLKDDLRFHLVLCPMLSHFTVKRYVCGTKNRLDYQGHLVRWKIEVDWYGEPDRGGLVEYLIEGLLARPKA
jgi:hypothetical protein